MGRNWKPTVCLVAVAVVATGCGSSAHRASEAAAKACSRGEAQQAVPPASFRLATDRLAALGWERNSGAEGCGLALFPVPGDLRLYSAMYVNARHETVTMNFITSASASDLRRARDAFLADAARRGFRGARTDGERFYLAVPLRVRQTQKDVVGWVVSGEAAIVVQRFVKLPVHDDAPSFLDQLTHG